MKKWHPEAVVAELRAEGANGVLFDARLRPGLRQDHGRTSSPGGGAWPAVTVGSSGVPSPALRQFDDCLDEDCPSTPLTAEQSNSSVVLGDRGDLEVHPAFRGGQSTPASKSGAS